MIGTTSSGTLIVLLGTYILYVHNHSKWTLNVTAALEVGRHGILATYNLGWLRQAENQHVSIPLTDVPAPSDPSAAAEIEDLTVLHYDADFDLIASVTGQRCEWIVPRGSID